jgi:DNA-binding beta-propeller fold protein YncE
MNFAKNLAFYRIRYLYREKNHTLRWPYMQYLKVFIFLGIMILILFPGVGSASYDYFFSWGSPGEDAGQFELPRGISIDQDGNVYVIDQLNNRTEAFTREGEFIREWGSYGTGDGQFDMPFGILVDNNRVYVADRKNNRVQIFTLEGDYLDQWDTEALHGIPFQPVSIAVSPSGYFFVGGIGGIRVYSSDGSCQATWGSFGTDDEQFQIPFGVACNSTGYIYAADTLSCRIQILSPDGRFVTRFGEKGSGEGEFFFPTGLAIDEQDRVFVADSNNDRVQVLDPSGNFLAKWGSGGSNPGQSEFVTGIAIHIPARGTRPVPELVYTTDLENGRVQVFVIEETPIITGTDPGSGRSGARSQLIRITGEEYLAGCTIRLEREGASPISATILGSPLENRILAKVNLASAAPGPWDIVVENPGGTEGRLKGGFLVK